MTSPIGGGPTTTTNPGGIAGAPYATQIDADLAALWKRVPRRLTVTGTNVLTATTPVGDLAISALVEGMRLVFTPVANNTGAMTIAVDGLPAVALVNSQGTALNAGQVRSGEPCEAVIDATGKARVVVGIFTSALPSKTTILANQRVNANGGGLTTGSDQTVALNTKLIDEIGVSGTLPDFTLPAGSYDIDIEVVIDNTGSSQLRLYNVTDGADVAGVYGLTERANASNFGSPLSAKGRFTLAAPKTLRVVARVSTTNSGDGQGPGGLDGGWFATANLNHALVIIQEARGNVAGAPQGGSFTPTVAGGTSAGAGTYTKQVGRYERIGNLVWFNIELAWSAHTGTGALRIAGLPFANGARETVCSVSVDSLTFTGQIGAYIPASGTGIRLGQQATGAARSEPSIDTAASLTISGCYSLA